MGRKMEYRQGETYLAMIDDERVEVEGLKIHKKTLHIKIDDEKEFKRYKKWKLEEAIIEWQMNSEEHCENCDCILETKEQIDFIFEVGYNICRSCYE